jgi:hypothetical protein
LFRRNSIAGPFSCFQWILGLKCLYSVQLCNSKNLYSVTVFQSKVQSHMKYEKKLYVENIHGHDDMTPQGLETHAIILEILILAQYVFIISFNIYMVDAS